MARPTKRTPTTEEKIVDAIRQGMTYRLAALCAGIGESMLRDWMARDDAGDEGFTEFVAAVRLAEAEGDAQSGVH